MKIPTFQREMHTPFRARSLWALLAAGVLACLTLTSCGKRAERPPELTFMAALLPSEQAKYTQVLKPFTEQTGIRVRLIAQQYEQIRSAIEAEAQAGRGSLDVAELDVYQLALVAKAMTSLEALIQSERELTGVVAKDAWTAGQFGQPPRLLYVPHRLNWQALIYDATVLARPPADWGELLAVARAHPGAIGMKCAKYEGLACDLFPYLWQAGADPLRPDTPQARRAMEFVKALSADFNKAVRSYKEETIAQAQEYREVNLHANWPSVAQNFRDKKLLPQIFKTAPLPSGPEGRATILGGGYLGIPATAPHPAEAGKLLDYLTSAETQKQLAGRLGWFPIRPEGWDAMSEKDRSDLAGFLAMSKDVRARPNVSYYEAVSRLWQDGFYAIVFEDKETTATLRSMQAQVDATVERTGSR